MFEKEAEEYVKAFTDRSHIWSNDKLMQLQLREAYKDGAELGCKKANEELEEKISVLLSCKNCPENKDGLICQKEYEGKCLAQKIQYIKELKEENAELRTKTTALENANRAMIKELDEMTSGGVSVLENVVRSKEQLAKAKGIIKNLLDVAKFYNKHRDRGAIMDITPIYDAEQFLKEETE